MKLTLSRNARILLEHRFLRKNDGGKVVETAEQMFRKVARYVSIADVKYGYKERVERLLKRHNLPSSQFWWLATHTKDLGFAASDKEIRKTEECFAELLCSLDFLPTSVTLLNSAKKLPQLASGFVLPIGDDVTSIFKTLSMAALIQQSGGGTGLSFSTLRPRGDAVQRVSGKASGPLSFMKVFDVTAEQMKHGGQRRGAHLAVLRIDHPDIVDFLTAKAGGAFSQLNTIIAVTDKFMQALGKSTTYNLVNPRTRGVVKKEDARRIFHLLCEMGWKHSDPGIIFIDEMNRHNPTPRVGLYEATTPCGEVPLLAFEACSTGSMNLAQMVKDGAVDWERLKAGVWHAVHFLDNVIDMSDYQFPEVFDIVHAHRKIGLGVMGFADMLFQLKLSYASEKAVQLGEDIMKFIDEEARLASVELAKVRGTFPNHKKSVYVKTKERLRNATCTVIAPTGSISIIAGCSSGIEPVFGIAFKQMIDRERLIEINKYFVDSAKREGVYTDKLMERVMEIGTVKGLFIPAWMKRVFVSASDVPAEWHVKMQAAFQRHCQNAVSKVIHLPETATVDEVMGVYRQAYDLKCKSVTIYREGSTMSRVLGFGTACERMSDKSNVRHGGV